jgi:hypothetical protein
MAPTALTSPLDLVRLARTAPRLEALIAAMSRGSHVGYARRSAGTHDFGLTNRHNRGPPPGYGFSRMTPDLMALNIRQYPQLSQTRRNTGMTNPSAAATTRAKGGTSWTSVTVQTLAWHTGHCRPAGVDFLRTHSAAVSLRSSRATTGSIPSHSSSTCGMVVSLEVVAQLKAARDSSRRERVGGTRSRDRKPWQDPGWEPDRDAVLSRAHQVVRQLAALTSQPG